MVSSVLSTKNVKLEKSHCQCCGQEYPGWVDPVVWGKYYPDQYASYLTNAEMTHTVDRRSLIV